jgi:hypothetical protein
LVVENLAEEFQLRESGEESVEGFGHRPEKPGDCKEDQFPKGED